MKTKKVWSKLENKYIKVSKKDYDLVKNSGYWQMYYSLKKPKEKRK